MNLLDAELWLAERIRRHGIALSVFEGITDKAERCKRLRQVLIEQHLVEVVAGTNQEGKAETYSQVFERLYGEPLESNSSRSKSRKKDQQP